MKIKFQEKGFTLIELLISISLIIIIAGISSPIYYNFHIKNELDTTLFSATQYIRKAQFFSQFGERDSAWGIKIKENELTLFKGENYNNRVVDFDELFFFSKSISASGLEEIVFEKNTGEPNVFGEIIFSSSTNEKRVITINSKGIIDYSAFFDEEEDDDEESYFCGGEGTLSDPYLICTANDLNEVREGLSLHYRLENDIDLNVTPYNTGEGWSPIGNLENSFTGTFDGGGNNISNLYINRPEEDYIGLFGHINATPGEEAKVYDLGLVNVNITGRNYTGGITGHIGGVWNADGKITRSYVEGNIKGGGSTGGVAGYTAYKSYLENVYSMCSIEGGWGTGGISGSHWGTNNFIVNSYSISGLSSGGGVGGIIGQGISGNVINSYWNTDIYPSSPAGTGKTTEEMKDINTFSGWDISTSSIDLNEGYPYFGWQEDRDDFAWLISGESDPEPLINKATDKNKFTTNYVDFGSAGNLAESEPLSALWQVNQGGENLDIWVNYDMGEKKEINTYELTPTTIDPSRSPKSWIFQGADTIEGPYETIDTRENITGWVGEVPVTFSLSETANNRYYRLLISESNHDLRLALSRLRILF